MHFGLTLTFGTEITGSGRSSRLALQHVTISTSSRSGRTVFERRPHYIDEAHNLPKALRALHSSKVSLPIAEAVLAQLIAYTDRYATRLAGRNLHYLGQLRRIPMAFNQYLKRNGHDNNTNRPALMCPEESFCWNKSWITLTFFKILRYLKNSRLSQNLGFVCQTTVAASTDTTPGDNNNNVNSRLVSKHVSAKAPVQSFLEKLIMTSGEGKIVTDWPSTSGEPNECHILPFAMFFCNRQLILIKFFKKLTRSPWWAHSVLLHTWPLNCFRVIKMNNFSKKRRTQMNAFKTAATRSAVINSQLVMFDHLGSQPMDCLYLRPCRSCIQCPS